MAADGWPGVVRDCVRIVVCGAGTIYLASRGLISGTEAALALATVGAGGAVAAIVRAKKLPRKVE